jgi:hypothetical protein
VLQSEAILTLPVFHPVRLSLGGRVAVMPTFRAAAIPLSF